MTFRMSLKPRDNLPFVSPRQSMTTYDQDFGAGPPHITPRIESRMAVSRLDVIEDRLINQEKTTHVSQPVSVMSPLYS